MSWFEKRNTLKALPTKKWLFPFASIGKYGQFLKENNKRYHKLTLTGKSVTGRKQSTNVFFLHRNEDVVNYLNNDTEIDLSNYDRALHNGGLGTKFFISADEDNTRKQWEVLEAAFTLSPSLQRLPPNRKNTADITNPNNQTQNETYDLIAEQAERAVNEAIAEIYKAPKKQPLFSKILKGKMNGNEVNLVTRYGHSVTHIFVRDFLGLEIPIRPKHNRGKGFAFWISVMFGNLFVNPGGRMFPITWMSRVYSRKYINAIEKSYKNPKEGSLLYRLKTLERDSLDKFNLTQPQYRAIVNNIIMEVGGSFQYITGQAFSGILKSIDEEQTRLNVVNESALDKKQKLTSKNPDITNKDILRIIGQIKQAPRAMIDEYLRLNSPTRFLFRTVSASQERFSITDDPNDDESFAIPGDLLCLLTAQASRDASVFAKPDEVNLPDASNPKKYCPHYVHFGGPEDHLNPSPMRPDKYHPCLGQYWARTMLETMLDGLLRFPNLRVQKTGLHKASKYIAQFDPEPTEQTFISIVSEIPRGYYSTAKHHLEDWGNPVSANDEDGLGHKLANCKSVHFLSANTVQGQENIKGFLRRILERIGLVDADAPLKYEPDHLLIEMSVDGSSLDAIDELCEHYGDELYELYDSCGIIKSSGISNGKKKDLITRQLHKDSYTLEQSMWPTLFNSKATMGLPFTGTAGLSCSRIVAENQLSEKINEIITDKGDEFQYKSAHGRLYEIRQSLFEEQSFLSDSSSERLDDLKWVLGGSESPSFAENFDDPWIKRFSDKKLGALDYLQLVGKLFPSTLYIPIFLGFLFVAAFLEFDGIAAEKATVSSFDMNAGTIAAYFICATFFGSLIGLTLRRFRLGWMGRAGDMMLVTAFFLMSIICFDHGSFGSPQLGAFSGFDFLPKTGIQAHPFVWDKAMLWNKDMVILFVLIGAGVLITGVMAFLELAKSPPIRGRFYSKPLAFFLVYSLIACIMYQHFYWIPINEMKDAKDNFVTNRFPNTDLMDLIFYPLQYVLIIILSIHAYNKSFRGSAANLVNRQNVLIFVILYLAIALLSFAPFSDITSTCTLMQFIFINVIAVPLIIVFVFSILYQWLTPSNSTQRKGGYLAILILAFILSIFINLNAAVREGLIGIIGPEFDANIIDGKYIKVTDRADIIAKLMDYANSIIIALPVAILLFGMIALILKSVLNRSEIQNTPHDSDTTLSNEEAMMANESEVGYEQNHMTSVQRLLPEWMRLHLFLPLSYHVIQRMLTQGIIRPGFLGNVGTVHFARWIKLPRSRNYAFVSNYDGSFESYLEDFVTKVNVGLNAAWGHCIGFPKIRNVFTLGASDGDRFIRWARGSTRPTPFWYSAYPKLTVEIIRRNALIRDGLVRAQSASDAEAWFDLFDSTTRPEHALQTDKIQSFVFGGSKNLTYGACLVIQPNSNADTAIVDKDFSDFISKIQDKVTFGQTKPENKAIYFALSRPGLDCLNVNKTRYDSHVWQGDKIIDENLEPNWFSSAFASGMGHPTRKRALGDTHQDYEWGDAKHNTLGVLLLYIDIDKGKSLEELEDEIKSLAKNSLSFKTIKFSPIEGKGFNAEPFGFADGVSNPIIKGTPQAARNPESIHAVNPGEFILGYRDNRDHFPASPELPTKEDIARTLPAIPNAQPQKYPSFDNNSSDNLRDLGRNGTYLVIRQLEQDVPKFQKNSLKEAESIIAKFSAEKQTMRAEVLAFKDKMIKQSTLPRLKKYCHYNPKDHTAFEAFIKAKIDEIKTDQLAKTLEAKMMGRWQDGQSLTTRPFYLNEATFATWLDLEKISFSDKCEFKNDASLTNSLDTAFLAKDNEFLFGRDDPQGYACPFGSHVRRSNPRESHQPGNERELGVSNRHRVLRRGRGYYTDDGKTGTFFMCLNADIVRQFEFVQQTWTNARNFHGLRNEYDPMANKDGEEFDFTIQCPGANQKMSISNFVTMRGGGYFFMPSKDALEYFARLNREA